MWSIIDILEQIIIKYVDTYELNVIKYKLVKVIYISKYFIGGGEFICLN